MNILYILAGYFGLVAAPLIAFYLGYKNGYTKGAEIRRYEVPKEKLKVYRPTKSADKEEKGYGGWFDS